MRATAAILPWALAIGGVVAGCHARLTSAPYGDAPPSPELLMAATSARLEAIQIPHAKIHEPRRAGAGLELVAQAPASFAGRIHLGGHEILQLAVHPEAYALRLVESRGSPWAPGFYTGPPSRCAVETLIGVSVSPAQVTALLLGGGPVLEEPTRIVERRWDRRRARELMTLRGDTHEEELEFAWIAGGWWFAGASVWLREGEDRRWLWTIRHERMRALGPYVLPSRTTIRQPSATPRRRRGRSSDEELVVVLDYGDPIVNPVLVSAAGGDTWSDDWDEEEGDDVDDEEPPPADGSNQAVEAQPAVSRRPIAPVFLLDSTGLTRRGDLCRTP